MYGIYKSAIGNILIESNGDAITCLEYIADDDVIENYNANDEQEAVIEQCKRELDEYFNGERKVFDVKVKYGQTDFRNKVWDALCEIPYGETVTYRDIAIKIGNEKAVRAVGGANHNNKLNIIVPCHRVIGKNGDLTGYGGGLWRKEWLLEHEQKMVGQD